MNALQQIKAVRKQQGELSRTVDCLEKEADEILEKGMKARIKTKGSLGTITWEFGCSEDRPNLLNIIPHDCRDNQDIMKRYEEVNSIWGTNITVAQVTKLRDFLNQFLEWNKLKGGQH